MKVIKVDTRVTIPSWKVSDSDDAEFIVRYHENESKAVAYFFVRPQISDESVALRILGYLVELDIPNHGYTVKLIDNTSSTHSMVKLQHLSECSGGQCPLFSKRV